MKQRRNASGSREDVRLGEELEGVEGGETEVEMEYVREEFKKDLLRHWKG